MSRTLLAWTAVLLTTVLVAWQAAQSETVKNDDAELYRLFVDALEHVDRNYVKEVDRRELIEHAITGMLEELDPYSNFIPPTEFKQFNQATTGKFGGVGIQVRPKKQAEPFLEVLSPVVGTPAYEAGILADDRIISVNGKNVEGMSQAEVVENLTGEPGTPVTVSVKHAPYEEPAIDITLTRALINIQSVLGEGHQPDDSWNYFIDAENKIAYIRITSFVQETAAELRRSLERIQADGAKGIIIDLRDNPGGLLTSAIEICDMFLKEGIIVSTKGRNTQDKSYTATPDEILPGIPMAILVNRWSASASEIVSACLQDHHRAVIIGERSFGKGSVQNVIELDDGKSALKLTTASYRRPSGKNIHRFKDSKEEDDWGVQPDEGFLIKLSEDAHRAYLVERSKRDRVRGKRPDGTHPDLKPAPTAPPADTKPAETTPPTTDSPTKEGDKEPTKEGEKEVPTKEGEKEAPTKEGEQPLADGPDTQLAKAIEYIRGKITGQAVPNETK
jgi:carboxyl-terminal processing protease